MVDGIKVDSLELQDIAAAGTRFEFTSGGLQSLPTYRGEDDVVPEAEGREPGTWIADQLEPAIHGMVMGSGESAQLGRESFATRAAALIAAMDTSQLVTLTVYAPNFGLAPDEIATLANVRPMRIVGVDPSALGYEGWEVTLEFVTTDTVAWVVTGGS